MLTKLQENCDRATLPAIEPGLLNKIKWSLILPGSNPSKPDKGTKSQHTNADQCNGKNMKGH